MKPESIFVYLIVFSISLALLGSGLFDFLRMHESMTGASLEFAVVKCTDGTVINKCSVTKPLYCSNGVLVDNCTKCGCPTNTTCITLTDSCNRAPIVLNPIISSIDSSNLSWHALGCSGLLLDADNDRMNVTVLWSLNSAVNRTFAYNNNYPNNTQFSAVLAGGNVSMGSWYCQITAYDGKAQTTVRSSTLQIADYVCSDGTIYGQCSVTKPKYCSGSGLIDYCSVCNCPSGLSCNATTNSCYAIIVLPQNCSDGTPNNQCSITEPLYCINGTLVSNCTYCNCSTGLLCNSTSDACYAPTCSDGTAYGSCSLVRPKYCENGTLIDDCSLCGCPSGQACNTTSDLCYVPMCSDGTLYGLCSVTLPKYCSNGTLINNCSLCGCPPDQSCNTTSNTCYIQTCSDGTLYNQCSVTKPKYCKDGTLINNCTYCGCPGALACSLLNDSCYVPNNLPTLALPVLNSTFGTNTASEDLRCYSYITDPDGDIMNVTANWYKNDAIAVSIMYKDIFNGTMVSVLKSGNLSAGDWWKCSMTAVDGKDAASSGLSNKLTVLLPPPANIAPYAPSPAINSSDGTNTASGNLNCYATIMDPNGDKMNATVEWLVNGAQSETISYLLSLDSGSYFNAVLLSGNLSVGESWSCRIRLYDGLAYSEWGASAALTIIAPPAIPLPPAPLPPSSETPPSAPSAPLPPGSEIPPSAPLAPACVHLLEVAVPENIYIPQMVTKQVSLVVKNTGTCAVSSVAADLVLPLGIKSNLYILDKGLDVNESQTISLTVLPTDAPAGVYPATLKLDAPNISMSKNATIWLLENPPYVASEEGVSQLKIFEYIILLILIDFVFGSVILLVWYRPKPEEDSI